MAMGGTAVLPFAVAAGAVVGVGAGVGYGGYKAVKYFQNKKKVYCLADGISCLGLYLILIHTATRAISWWE